jgi:hypothetical protein
MLVVDIEAPRNYRLWQSLDYRSGALALAVELSFLIQGGIKETPELKWP